MKPTQNNENGGRWREPEPESTQKFITPEAAKSIREGAGRYRFIKSGYTGGKKKPPEPTENPVQKKMAADSVPKIGTKREKSGKLSLGEAVRGEINDRLQSLRMNITLNSEDIIKGVICAVHIMLWAMVQTTFFAHFPLFGTVPDLMLSLTAAIALMEGEKWGGVCGLIAAFVIQALGNSGTGPELLALLYMPAGYVIGILSRYYFSNSLPVKAMYIAACGLGRAAVSAVTAAVMLDAPLKRILADIVVPEFFSTAAMAPIIYFVVWLTLKHFHKTREQRTEKGNAA